jgi:hypothetical protein
MNLLKTLKSRFSREPKYYLSIDDLPCGTWNEINETGDTTLLCLDKSKKSKATRSGKVWRDIQKQIVERWGVTQEYRERALKKKKIALLLIEAAVTGKRHLLTIAKAEQAELDKQDDVSKSFNFTTSIGILEKELHFKVNVREYSTAWYLDHVHLLNKKRDNG